MDIDGETEAVSREEVLLSVLCRIVMSGSTTRDELGSFPLFAIRPMEGTIVFHING